MAVASCTGGTAPSVSTAPSASTAASVGTAPSASGTVDPLAGLTGNQVETEAIANLKAASSLTLAGTATALSVGYTLSLELEPGQGCAGTVGLGGRGSFKFIMIGTTVYMKPDARFWEVNTGASAAAIIKAVKGRYVKTTTGKAGIAEMVGICHLSLLARAMVPVSGHAAKGTVTTLDGFRVLSLKNADGSVMHVTDTSKPEIVDFYDPEDASGGMDKFTFSVGAPVTLAPPPASEVVDGAPLGF